MTQKRGDITTKHVQKVHRRLRSAIWLPTGTFAVIAFAVLGTLLVIFGAIPNPLPAPPPTPAPTPVPRREARISVTCSDLATAGTEVKRKLIVKNAGSITETLRLKIDGYLASEFVSIFLSNNNGNPVPWEPPRSVDLGAFPPETQKHYQLITYRHAPDFDIEPPFLLQLLNASGQLVDEVFVAPSEHNFRGHITIITPTSSIQQPKVNICSSVRVNTAGNYRLNCFDSDGKSIHDDDRDIQSQKVVTFSCPIEKGEAGQWSIKLFPNLSSYHPDKEDSMGKAPLVTETFEVIPASYALALTMTGAFDPYPQKSILGLHYVVTNTGNLSSSIDIKYKPITHTVTTTLVVTHTTWTKPYTLTLVDREKTQPLLPNNAYLGPGQSVYLDAYVMHDGMPPEFILQIVPNSDPDNAIHHRESTEELELFSE